jgi:hypothetical protein
MIPATREVEVGESHSKASLARLAQDPKRKISKAKQTGIEQQVQGPAFNPLYH